MFNNFNFTEKLKIKYSMVAKSMVINGHRVTNNFFEVIHKKFCGHVTQYF